jgi:DNA-binding LacI/PurR family transcriptional regulator
VVITPQSNSVSVVEKTVTKIPVVYIDSPNQPNSLSASLDNFEGARLGTQHLIDLGHKNIVHIAGPSNWFDAVPRIDGYEKTMVAAGLKPRVIAADWNIETGYLIGKHLDIDTDKITGIFAANDNLSLGLMHAFRERGIAVPERISIVGFDDVPEAPYFAPPLTTLRPDFSRLGRVAMGLILRKLSGESVEISNNITPELIIRKSTAVPPKL